MEASNVYEFTRSDISGNPFLQRYTSDIACALQFLIEALPEASFSANFWIDFKRLIYFIYLNHSKYREKKAYNPGSGSTYKRRKTANIG